MSIKNPKVDLYLIDGCGRCKYYATPQCKVHDWRNALIALRSVVLECGLTEELKWSMPVYTVDDRNILMIAAFKDNCVLSFFKGSLLTDPASVLQKPGESSQAGRFFKFTSVEEVLNQDNLIRQYIAEAVAIEKSGAKVEFKKNPEPMPTELEQKLEDDPVFRDAFYRLTPGRQRGYILFFSQPKQSATRMSRIEKCTPRIFEGKGMHDY